MDFSTALPNGKHRRIPQTLGLDPVEMFDTAAAAAYLGGQHSPLARKSLENWRSSGRGPRFHKIGGLVRYARSDLDAWLAERVRGSTSEGG